MKNQTADNQKSSDDDFVSSSIQKVFKRYQEELSHIGSSDKKPNLDFYDRRRDSEGQNQGRYGIWYFEHK